MEYASNGKGNLGVTLGAIGTGLSVLSGGLGAINGVNGLLGNSNPGSANGCMINSKYVSKDEMAMLQELSAKESEIALLKADQASEIKMTEVYKQAHAEVAALRDDTAASIKELQTEINQNRREQDMWNANQNVVNAQVAAAIATNSNSISALQNCCNQITQLKIPNTAVCPGWGPVTISPTTTGTTVS